MITPESPNIPSVPSDKEQLIPYLEQLAQIIKTSLESVYADLDNGNERHPIVTTAPTVLDEGQITLYDDGTNVRLYTKVNGVIKYVTLT